MSELFDVGPREVKRKQGVERLREALEKYARSAICDYAIDALAADAGGET